MKRSDRIKLNFTRNWSLPGKERLVHWLKLSTGAQNTLKDGIIWLRDEHISLYSSADNFIENAILRTGTYEAEIGKLIYSLLKEGDIALDIGANIGLQSLRMSLSVGSGGQVYAFEPLHYLQNKLQQNLILNGVNNVLLMPVALSNEEAIREFTIQSNIWNQGTFSLKEKNDVGNTQKVTIKIGDDLPELANLSKLNLIKIDVEGFEWPVLQGISRIIIKHRPKIIFEYDENYWRQSGNNVLDCHAFFQQHNYRLYQVNDANATFIRDGASVNNGNVLCLPN